MIQPWDELLKSDDKHIYQLGLHIKNVHDSLTEGKITQSEFQELMEQTTRLQKQLDDADMLNLKINIMQCIKKLYDVALVAKSLAP